MTTTSEPTVYGLTFYQIIKMREYFVKTLMELKDFPEHPERFWRTLHSLMLRQKNEQT